MKFNLFNKRTRTAGLDIGSVSIKAMELAPKGAGFELVGFAESKLPKGILVGDNIVDTDTLAKQLERVMERPGGGHFTTNHVVVSLPEAKSFVRVIHIQSMSDSEVDNAIPYEAESYIPIPIDQVYLDWQKLQEVNGRMEILLIASPKAYVDELIMAVEKARLVPVALEVGSSALSRALIAKDKPETALVADITAARTDLIMVERGDLQFTSSIPIASDTFTEAIARGLGVTAEQAEKVKMAAGVGNTPEYPNVKTLLLPVLNNLVAEIKNILQFHAQHSKEVPSRIILSGGGSRLKHLIEFLAPEFADIPGLKVEVAHPALDIIRPAGITFSDEDMVGFITALGLAMRNEDN